MFVLDQQYSYYISTSREPCSNSGGQAIEDSNECREAALQTSLSASRITYRHKENAETLFPLPQCYESKEGTFSNVKECKDAMIRWSRMTSGIAYKNEENSIIYPSGCYIYGSSNIYWNMNDADTSHINVRRICKADGKFFIQLSILKQKTISHIT